jgi:tousled-like kinase
MNEKLASPSPGNSANTIHSYFVKNSQGGNSQGATPEDGSVPETLKFDSPPQQKDLSSEESNSKQLIGMDRIMEQRQEIEKLKSELQAANRRNSELQDQAQQKPTVVQDKSSERMLHHAQLALEEEKQYNVLLKQEVDRSQEELQQLRGQSGNSVKKAAKVLEVLVKKQAEQDARNTRKQLLSQSFRLGRIVSQRTGPHSTVDMWEDGHCFRDIQRRQGELLQFKEQLEQRKKKQAKLVQKNKKAKTEAAAGGKGGAGGGGSGEIGGAPVDASADLELLGEDEAIRLHTTQLKRDEVTLSEEKKGLENEKDVHVRGIKRVMSEDQSRFNTRPVLNQRYLLQCLLGKGGFSEVWKAFDLVEFREVACKIHQLNPQWSEFKKQNYTKHATREYEIHKSLEHPRIVRLFDVFEIDVNSFGTIMHYCEGTDLDHFLKGHRIVPEKEARALLVQILSGLKYLNTPAQHQSSSPNGASGAGSNGSSSGSTVNYPSPQGAHQPVRRSIIHYDLKPGNILFDKYGDVKITDFGLSKIMAEEDPHNSGFGGAATSMELTSQGAGTYWYLPPECFVTTGNTPPRISSKVSIKKKHACIYQLLRQLCCSHHLAPPASPLLTAYSFSCPLPFSGGRLVHWRHLLPDALRPSPVR